MRNIGHFVSSPSFAMRHSPFVIRHSIIRSSTLHQYNDTTP